MLQRGHDVGCGGEPVEQVAVLRIAVFLPVAGTTQVFDPALLQREETVVLHRLDDLGKMCVGIIPGHGLAPVGEQLQDLCGGQ